MMRILYQMVLALLVAGIIPASSVAAELGDEAGRKTAVSVPRSRQIDFVSSVTGRPYRLMIALPEAPPLPEGYPVFYVIDGGLYFATAVETMRLQGRHFITPAVIVGIGYQADDTTSALTLRNKDLTLPLSQAELAARIYASGDLRHPGQTGGLDDLLIMLRTEIRDKVAAIEKIDPSRQILFGHSLGGLAVLRQLLRDPGAYSGYIASSPSIWFKDRAVLADEAGLPAKLAKLDRPPVVLLDVGGTEERAPKLPPNFPIPQEEADREAAKIGMVSSLVALGARLNDMSGIRVTTVVFPDEDHASVVPAAISRGMRVTLPK